MNIAEDASPLGWPSRMWRVAETGHHPHVIAVLTTALLALLAPLRFSILVGRMDPSSYGYLSIFNTLTSVLPYVLILGLSWQLQIVSSRFGLGVTKRLRRIGIRLVAAASLPTVATAYVLAQQFPEAVAPGLLALLTVITSAAVGLTMLASQTLLGLGARSASTLAMFGYNVLLTVVILPFLWGDRPIGVVEVMGAWAVAAVVGLVFAVVCLATALSTFASVSIDPIPRRLIDIPRGIASLPAMVGPLLLLLVSRYVLGITADGAALATFALSWTLVDLAYLLSVNVPTLASTDIMRGTRAPLGVFVVSATACAVLVALGHGLLIFFLSGAAPQYHVSTAVTVAMGVGGIARLMIVSWLPRSVELAREGVVSVSYVIVALAMSGLLWLTKPTDPLMYASALSACLFTVGIVQLTIARRNPATRRLGTE
jgi:hypothetical protein